MGITGLITLSAAYLSALGRGSVAGVMGTGIMAAAGATDTAITDAAAIMGDLGMGTGEATAIGQGMDTVARRLAGMVAVGIAADIAAGDSTVMQAAASMVDLAFTVVEAVAVSTAVEEASTVEGAGPTAVAIGNW